MKYYVIDDGGIVYPYIFCSYEEAQDEADKFKTRSKVSITEVLVAT